MFPRAIVSKWIFSFRGAPQHMFYGIDNMVPVRRKSSPSTFLKYLVKNIREKLYLSINSNVLLYS